MKIWISGTVNQVKEAAQNGIATAAVTNPRVITEWLKQDADIRNIAKDITQATGLPLYIQFRGPNQKDFLKEFNYFNAVSDLIFPKLPATMEGIVTAKEFEKNGIHTLVTAVSSVSQAYACAVAGVTSICPYFNRLRETGVDVMQFIKDIRSVYAANHINTSLMLASIRSVSDAEEAVLAGADGVILFYEEYKGLFENPVSQSLLKSFDKDWFSVKYL